MKRVRTIGLACALSSIAWAQGAGAIPQKFEVASIRANRSGSGRTTVGTTPGGLYTATNVSLEMLLETAFGVQDFRIVGGPPWLGSERYDISAKAATAAEMNNAQLRPLLQALLAERFRLRFRRETRELPVYALVVTKDGPKMALHKGGGDSSSHISSESGRMVVQSTKLSMAVLADRVGSELRQFVIDRTGLTGEYDFRLEWTRGPGEGASLPEMAENHLGMDGPSLFTALQEQLGLKLIPQKGPVEVIVIESIEKASDN